MHYAFFKQCKSAWLLHKRSSLQSCQIFQRWSYSYIKKFSCKHFKMILWYVSRTFPSMLVLFTRLTYVNSSQRCDVLCFFVAIKVHLKICKLLSPDNGIINGLQVSILVTLKIFLAYNSNNFVIWERKKCS